MATTTKTTKKSAKKEELQSMLRIRVRAYENKILDASVKQIIDTATRYDAVVRGPDSFADRDQKVHREPLTVHLQKCP